MSQAYYDWKFFYEHGWVTDTQLQEVVTLGGLTQEEYDEIVG